MYEEGSVENVITIPAVDDAAAEAGPSPVLCLSISEQVPQQAYSMRTHVH